MLFSCRVHRLRIKSVVLPSFSERPALSRKQMNKYVVAEQHTVGGASVAKNDKSRREVTDRLDCLQKMKDITVGISTRHVACQEKP